MDGKEETKTETTGEDTKDTKIEAGYYLFSTNLLR